MDNGKYYVAGYHLEHGTTPMRRPCCYFHTWNWNQYLRAAGSWQAGIYLLLHSSHSIVGTSGATFYITGVQLEKGSTATSFDYRPYGTELALCQRYFEMSNNIGTAPGAATTVGFLANGGFYGGPSSSYGVRVDTSIQVTKRVDPTVTYL